MRRTPFLLVVLAIFALAGFAPARQAESSLAVGVSCSNTGSQGFACYATASGGSGVYTSYQWSWYQKNLSNNHVIGGYSVTWSDPEFSETCKLGYTVFVTVTVTDSQGATGTASTQKGCRYWPD
jgi:hypothetical protein